MASESILITKFDACRSLMDNFLPVARLYLF